MLIECICVMKQNFKQYNRFIFNITNFLCPEMDEPGTCNIFKMNFYYEFANHKKQKPELDIFDQAFRANEMAFNQSRFASG